MASRPEVSVVIPTKNRWSRLERTLLGALRQEEVDVEVVVVDDGGSDGTSEHLRALNDPRVAVIRNEQSRGHAGARNAGGRAAHADWLAFLDDDDLWSPRKLAIQLAAARTARARWAYSAAVLVDEHLRVLEPWGPPPEPDRVITELLASCAVPAASSNILVTRAEFEDIGGFDEAISIANDWDICLRLATRSRPASCPDALVAYVRHASNQHAVQVEDSVADFRILAEKHRRRGLRLDGVRFSRWLAAIHRRAGHRGTAARAYLWGAVHFRNPGNLVRSVGVLMGERAMRAGAPRTAGGTLSEPAWLAEYR